MIWLLAALQHVGMEEGIAFISFDALITVGFSSTSFSQAGSPMKGSVLYYRSSLFLLDSMT